MNLEVEEIIQESKAKDILVKLSQGEIEEVKSIIKFRIDNKARVTGKNDDHSFYLNVMFDILKNDEFNLGEFYDKHKQKFDVEIFDSLNELLRFLFVLDNLDSNKNTTLFLSKFLLHLIREAANYVEKNSKNHITNSMGLWMFGAGIRSRADELASYFKKKKDDYREMSARYYKHQISSNIMSHYPHMIGPDTLQLAEKYEDLGNTKTAIGGYWAVINDFEYFLEEIEFEMEDNEVGEIFELHDDQVLTLRTLVEASKNAKRLGESINDSLVSRAEVILKKMNKK